ncbi:carbonic anhydrase 2 [Geobacter sp. OR-1]|uniref:carbonic anhydrase n=1 Tax=Geobacter sp. OR-1 TaxID=1266765 RepID=UPI000543F772|nr:carbonic anhydrase [Geobacter sp. OR-1]GAM11843.1 carbonic anhydrase 2 [Geobacter sp. OR-1]
MKWFYDLKPSTKFLSSFILIPLIAGGAWAETGIDKRVEEFKAGMEKTAPHGEGKAVTAVHGDNGNKPAAHTPAKKEKHAAKGHSQKATASHGGGGHGEHVAGINADEALNQLLNGNKRYVSGHAKGPNRTVARRTELARAQHPKAVVVSCSDSRVPPELLFDQGYGDIFVVRTAGNIVDSIALGSIEYAVDHLGTKLVLVLGHERCGAVTAALQGGEAPGNIKSVVEMIKPAVEKGKARHSGHGELLDTCIRSNVKQVAEKIRTAAPIISEAVEDGMVKVMGAYYDLDSGAVNMTYMPN